jgi:multidrug efflux pump subunit AcrA (membrane-fusion protein)
MCGCSQEKNTLTHAHDVLVKKEKIITSVYYSGIIQPLKTMIVTSPEEGIVEEMSFHYGDVVDLNQPLFTINSAKFQSDYKVALMQYIKSKTEFNNSRSQLSEAKFLHQHELISDDDFKAKQTNFYTSQLSFIEAENVLTSMLKQLNAKELNLSHLNIENIDKINQVLNAKEGAQKIKIVAPAKGVALIPIKNEGEESNLKKISQGGDVKKGDVLAMIGDVSGYTIRISVNEFNVNQLQRGQKVKVTGTAFPQYVLEGEIASIDRQGQPAQGGLPVFPVEIIIPKVDAAARAVIHIGMSAKVEVNIESKLLLTIPIAAVFTKQGSPHVKLAKDQKIIETPIQTGMTTASRVVVEANLEEGDHVVF